MTLETKDKKIRPIRSFVLRQGRLTNAQEKAIHEMFPVYGVPYEASPIDLDVLFGRLASPKVLEIGFGMGETTATIAKGNPESDFLGIEVHTPGIGSLLKRIGEFELTNVRIIQHDAVEVVSTMIKDQSLDGIHVFFPDPWHKKKHHKRRLINADFLKLLSSKMKVGAYIHLATDWKDYAEWIMELMQAEATLKNSVEGYHERPDYRPLTKFENRGIKLGHGVWDIIFTRK